MATKQVDSAGYRLDNGWDPVPALASVSIYLADGYGVNTDGTEGGNPVTTPVSATVTGNEWQAQLHPNSLITPADTIYRVEEVDGGARTFVYFVEVPNGSGPYEVVDITTSASAVVEETALSLDNPLLVPFSKAGSLVTGTGLLSFVLPVAVEILGVRLRCNTAPTGTSGSPISGQSLVVDVNKNGTTIFSTQANRPCVASGATSETAVNRPDVTSAAAGDRLSLDVDYVGSTTPGADLTVTIHCSVV